MCGMLGDRTKFDRFGDITTQVRDIDRSIALCKVSSIFFRLQEHKVSFLLWIVPIEIELMKQDKSFIGSSTIERCEMQLS